jgi:hypothetical protein
MRVKLPPIFELVDTMRQVMRRLRACLSGYRLFLPRANACAKVVFGNQPIYDLTNLQCVTSGTEIKLTAFPFGADLNDHEPSLAAVTVNRGRIEHYTPVFSQDLLMAAYAQRKKPLILIRDPVFLLPYNTNHFGHFTGECIGALIYFSRVLQGADRKIQMLSPASLDKAILRHGNPQTLVKLDPLKLASHNLIFKDAVLLPRLTPWQNLALSTEIFGNLPATAVKSQDRIFLTSERNSRIANIEALKSFLVDEGFYILNPQNHDFEDTLTLVRDADLLLTEAGSITHNILLARTKPYHCLISDQALQLSTKDFIGGGVFNTFKTYNTRYHYFKATGAFGAHHPYSNQIEVDIARLKTEILF